MGLFFFFRDEDKIRCEVNFLAGPEMDLAWHACLLGTTCSLSWAASCL